MQLSHMPSLSVLDTVSMCVV